MVSSVIAAFPPNILVATPIFLTSLRQCKPKSGYAIGWIKKILTYLTLPGVLLLNGIKSLMRSNPPDMGWGVEVAAWCRRGCCDCGGWAFAGLFDRDVLRRSNSSSIPPPPPLLPANAAAPALDANGADWFFAGDSQGDDRLLLLDAPIDMPDQTEERQQIHNNPFSGIPLSS